MFSPLAVVVYVVDGDTIKVRTSFLISFKYTTTFRYACLDTPEKEEPFFEQASTTNRQLVENKPVSFSIIDKDKYNRNVAYLYVYNNSFLGKLQSKLSFDGIFVNEKLLRAGLAVYYDVSRKCTRYPQLLEAQKYAFENSLGMWNIYKHLKNIKFIIGYRVFHLEGCEKIRKQKKQYITLEQAVYRGYSPCRSCKPLITLYLKKTGR
ncbi:MAG: thermonuclease family protein [Planctomycetota bacterium]